MGLVPCRLAPYTATVYPTKLNGAPAAIERRVEVARQDRRDERIARMLSLVAERLRGRAARVALPGSHGIPPP